MATRTSVGIAGSEGLRLFGWLVLAAFAGGPIFSGPGAVLRWESGDGHRRAPLSIPPSTKTGFTRLPAATTGVAFTNVLSRERIMMNANLLNGSGVALGDQDGDGLCDVYLCDLGGTNALFRNLGDWRFANVTEAAGVACPGQTSTGAVFADLDGDADLDLLVTSMGGPNACFSNDGRGRFTNVTATAGLSSRLGSASMALADIDGNGTLDLYVANYGATSLLRSGGAVSYRMVDGNPVVTGRHAKRIKIIDGVMYELGEPDALYLNDGRGRFRPVSWTDGTFVGEDGRALGEAPWDQGLTVLFRDFDGDGLPDLYVCNDASTPDRFWRNDGHGRFRAVEALAQRQTSYYSMCADSADLDRDGHDDFLVLDMLSRNHRLVMTQMSDMHPQPRRIGEFTDRPQVRRNTLFRSRGDGTYAEIAQFGDLSASDWSWSVVFLDVDLDGWEDALIANGFAYDMDDLDTRQRIRAMGRVSVGESRRNVLLFPRLETPNLAFHNRRDLTFRETGKEWGFDSTQVSNGMALADLDNDGDLDVVINCLNGPALIYRNDSSAPRLGVRLKGKSPNLQGIGARIRVVGGPVIQTQEVIAGGRYVSGDDPMRVFATGVATNLTIEVTWRSGKRSVVGGVRPNWIYEIDEAQAREVAAGKAPEAKAMFEDASGLIGHRHHEEPYEEGTRQPLLPKLLGQAGPGVAWFDWDGDGDEDLVVGTGRGGGLGVFRNDGSGGFGRWTGGGIDGPVPDDLGGLVGWRTGGGGGTLLAALGNYETGSAREPSVLRYEASGAGVVRGEAVGGQEGCRGPLALGDIDGDGRLELFVGVRVVPGRYPEVAGSRIYRERGGRWEVDEKRSGVLEKVGLVNGAVFGDVNADGNADLVVACDWGPVRVYLGSREGLEEATDRLGLGKYVGWWNGVTTGDFDGDGRMDLVASNWGRNTRYEGHRGRGLRLYYGDLDGNGTTDLVEGYYDEGLGKWVPERALDAMSEGLPQLRERYATHRAYGEAGLEEILGVGLERAKVVEANWLETTVFLNRGERFEARALPAEAQWAPGFGVGVVDVDGDGKEDVFVAQNFFATAAGTSRYDAGRGLWLRGDGKGGFRAISGEESGVKVYGEQRGSALADYDGDGRVDLVVTQNGAETKLYRNVGAKPGLRVRLVGAEGNLAGISAAMRLYYGEKAGPVREVHGGSGYWSQDGAVQVLGTPEPPTRLWVRWPGGRVTIAEVPPEAREIRLGLRGESEALD